MCDVGLANAKSRKYPVFLFVSSVTCRKLTDSFMHMVELVVY